MERRRFAQLAAVAALGLGGTALWVFGSRGNSAAALEPLFPRVVIAPGDDPSAVPLAIENAHLIEIDRVGALLVHNADRVRRQKPHAYQDIDGRRRDVPARFDITAAGDPRLVVGPYDRTRPLVIEPELGRDDVQP